MSAPETDRPVLLEGRGLVAGYLAGVPILNGCDLVLGEGERVGIIGPNGAGKSTLLKAMFGLLAVWSGEIDFRGDSVRGLAAHSLVERGIGYVPQSDNVFAPLTVEENLEMGLFLRPKDFRRRFDQVAGLFPLVAARRHQRAGAMSGGERQLVAMARALMMEPAVLLLDEPSAGLSPLVQDEVFGRITEINETGVAILMVEQNARRCLEISHRAYVLDQGTNAYTGTGEALLNDPRVIELYLGTLARRRP